MRGKDHLILLGQAVQNLAGNLLKLRMQINLRILHQDDAGQGLRLVNIRLQKRKYINTADTFTH